MADNEIDIDHEYSDDLVCPYCGYTNADSWEIDDYVGIVKDECGECGQEFTYEIEYSRTFTSRKKASTVKKVISK